MFEIVAWISVVIVLGVIGLHQLVSPAKGGVKYVSTFPAETGRWWCFWDKGLTGLVRLKRLSYLLALFSVLGLAVTSFVPRLLMGQAMSGYLLMMHVALSGVFVACVTFGVLTYSHDCRLTEEDWGVLLAACRCRCLQVLRNAGLCSKLTFWLAALLTVPSALSMVASMYPVFGTHTLEFLFRVHQYTGLGIALALLLHVYFTVRSKKAA